MWILLCNSPESYDKVYAKSNAAEVLENQLQSWKSDRTCIKDRSNDIVYGDRNSNYDEKMAHLISDYANFGTQIKGLVNEAISQVNDEKKKQKLLVTKIVKIIQGYMRTL
jgi:hypothetical protein